MRFLAAASLGVASLVAMACAGNTEQAVAISSVSPASAYNEEKVSIVIGGGPFRPVYDIDTGGGRATMELGSFTGFIASPLSADEPRPFDNLLWVTSSELLAVLPAGVPAGKYDVVVRDPRGLVARLADGFESRGPDTDKPIVTIIQPPERTIVLAGAKVPVAVLVADAPGRLKSIVWNAATGDAPTTIGFCPVGPMTDETMCRFTFPAPEPAQAGQSLVVSITATDSAGNVTHATRSLALSVPPTVTSVAPLEGPAAGGTKIVVTGANFVPGTQVLIDGVVATLMEDGLEAGRTLRAWTPAHEPGFVDVSVRAGSAEVVADDQFHYVGTPVVLAVGPAQGPVTGGTRVAIVGKNFREGATRILFGTSDGEIEAPLVCPKLISPSRIEGFTPRGSGAMSIYARDPIGGEGVLKDIFTFLEIDTPDVAPPPPPRCPEGPQ